MPYVYAPVFTLFPGQKQTHTIFFQGLCKISNCLRKMTIKNNKKFYGIMKIKFTFTVVNSLLL